MNLKKDAGNFWELIPSDLNNELDYLVAALPEETCSMDFSTEKQAKTVKKRLKMN